MIRDPHMSEVTIPNGAVLSADYFSLDESV